jgi:cytochrome c-type biogenesis protein CcmH
MVSMGMVWFVAGLVIGVSGSWAAPRLWPRARAFVQARTPYVIAGGLIVAFGVAAAIIHSAVSSRRTPAAGEVPHATASADSPAGSSASAPAQSMGAAVAGLEARLAKQGGSDADWELLAKAYDFLGRADDAKRARAHIASPPSTAAATAQPMSLETLIAEANAAGNASAPATATAEAPASAPPPATLAELRRRVQEHPQDVSAWLALADLYRAEHDNDAARDALAKVVALHGMTAQSWADYADVLASVSGGSLTGAAGKAIDAALALDPANAKALWLKASQAHEEHQYAAALGWWQKLRAVLPAGSPEVRVIDGNIAEDTQLGGLAPATTAGVASTRAALAPAAPAGSEVSGTVSVDSRLASQVQPDATLFIYAKAADSPGPPLAVMRTTASGWPVRFHLDDSMAMLPSRRLSQFDKVVVEARISRSGQATPGSGDLYATSSTLNPAAGQRLALVINREIN